ISVMPAATAACTVATHSSTLVAPQTPPSPPPPRVRIDTGHSRPSLRCCIIKSHPIIFSASASDPFVPGLQRNGRRDRNRSDHTCYRVNAVTAEANSRLDGVMLRAQLAATAGSVDEQQRIRTE